MICMTTHIANCGYSNLFTAGLFKVGLGQSTPSDAQRPFLDHLHQTSPSPRTLLPPSDSSLHGSQHHIQVPEPGLRSFHIVKSTSPTKSSFLNAWLLNDRRRDSTGLSSAGSTLQSLSALAEPDGSCDLPQPVSRIKRSIPSSPKPPPTAPPPPPPLSLLIPHAPSRTITLEQNQARPITSPGKQTFTPAINEDWPSSPLQGDGEAIPDSR